MKQVFLTNISLDNTSTFYFNPSASYGADNTPLTTTGGRVTSTEANAYFIVPTAGTIRNLYVKTDAAAGSGKTWTFTVRQNGSDTAVATTVSGVSATTGNSSSNSIVVAAGDLISISTAATAASAGTTAGLSLEYETNTFGYSAINGGLREIAASPGYARFGFYHQNNDTTYDSRVEVPMPFDCTIRAVYVNLTVAPGSGKSKKLRLYKNTSLQATADCSVVDTATAANTTGLSISVTAGDTLHVEVEKAGGPASSNTRYTYLVEANQNGNSFVGIAGGIFGKLNGVYGPLTGAIEDISSTTDLRAYCGETPFNLTNLYAAFNASVNVADSKTFTIQKNGSNSALALSISNASSGHDISDSVSFAVTDVVGVSITHSGTSTSTTLDGTITMTQYVSPGALGGMLLRGVG